MSKPSETSRSITCWICSSLAPGSIKTTIGIPDSLLIALSFFRLVVHHGAFHGSRFIENALEEAPDCGRAEWSVICPLHRREHFAFAIGLIKRRSIRLFQAANFDNAARSFIQ